MKDEDAALDAVVASLRAIIEIVEGDFEAELRIAEARFGIGLPPIFRKFYARVGGTVRPTTPSNGWLSLWPPSHWRTRYDVPLPDAYDAPTGAVIFADHCDESWWYALDPRHNAGTPDAIYILDGARPAREVACNLAVFLTDALHNRHSIYPAFLV